MGRIVEHNSTLNSKRKLLISRNAWREEKYYSRFCVSTSVT